MAVREQGVTVRYERRTAWTSLHADPSVVRRLVRLLEEVLESPADADVCWYGRRLAEIKAEINGENKGAAEASEDSSQPQPG